MAEEFETVELEYSEEDILYFLVDEEEHEVGFVLEEGGREVEYYYEGFDGDDYEVVEELEPSEPDGTMAAGKPNGAGDHRATGDEDGLDKPEEPYVPEKAEDHGYLHKLAAIAGHEGNKARSKAEAKLDTVRGKAEVQLDKAKAAATEQASKAKAAADEADLGITREGVKEATSDLNAIAKEGAETAKELKEAYDDIMENFGFLVPKKVRRKLP